MFDEMLTSRYAHAGIEVLAGIGKGNLVIRSGQSSRFMKILDILLVEDTIAVGSVRGPATKSN